MTNLPSVRPVVLTGFDLEVECPRCGDVQLTSDSVESLLSCVGSRDHLELVATGGRYRLTYTLWCWSCGHTFSGRLSVTSRAALRSEDGAGYGPD